MVSKSIITHTRPSTWRNSDRPENHKERKRETIKQSIYYYKLLTTLLMNEMSNEIRGKCIFG